MLGSLSERGRAVNATLTCPRRLSFAAPMRTLACAVPVLLLFACGSSKPSPAGPGAPGPGAPAATKVGPAGDLATYYVGTSEAHAGAHSLFKGEVAAQRVVSRQAGTIVETVAESGDKPAEFIVTMQVQGAHFTMTEAAKTFTGEGDLVGDPWAWTHWSSTSTMPDGATVTSNDALTASGLHVEKHYTGQGNGIVFDIVEELTAVDQATYQAKRTQIMSQQPVVQKPQ
jgi:hypothetical protein